MLEALFAGPIQHLEKPNILSEPLRSLSELGRALLRLKMRKCGDDVGLTAERLKHVPAKFWEHLLSVYNGILCHGIASIAVLHFIYHAANKDATNASCWVSANN